MDSLLDELKKFRKEDCRPDAIGEWLKRVDFLSLDYAPYLPSGKGEAAYLRQCLHEEPLQCLLIKWPPDSSSAVHLHDGFWGFVAVLKGRICNEDFILKGKELKAYEPQVYKEGDLLEEKDNSIHRISNPQRKAESISLHFYFPPLDNLAGMKLFDIENKRIGRLGKKAKAASWDIPSEHFASIEEKAFTFK